MTPLVITDMPNMELNMFDCISTRKEYFIPSREVPIIDYMVSVFPRNENRDPFTFVYGLFKPKDISFAYNQDDIVSIANVMFADSAPLNETEQEALNTTLKQSIKTIPTLVGRK